MNQTTSPKAIPGPPAFSRSSHGPLVQDIILYGRRMKASDLNLGIGKNTMEVFGRIWDIPGITISAEDINAFIQEHLSDHEIENIAGHVGVADGASRDVTNGNVRIHAYRCRNSTRLALRLLEPEIPRFENLGLPEVIRSFVEFQSGIVLVTGKTGAGKTSALAALLDIINRTQNHHIYTLEDPIEYEHQQYPNSLISQTEIGRDVISYEEGLRGILRAAPHVMMFGELRDAESVNAALQASSSGHLVFSTLHTSEATETVQRLINFFQPEQHNNIRYQLAQSLRATVSLRLLPKADLRGRVSCSEVLINSSAAIGTMLEDPVKIKQLRNEIKMGQKDGMQTLEDALSRLVAEGTITLGVAKAATNYPDEVRAGDGRSI